MYAVVKTGGKQYRVQEGRSLTVDRIAGEPGETVELGEVLLMGEGDDVTVGSPTVAGARVLGTIAEQGRARKVLVFRYKAKTRSRKKTGHRQPFTRVVVSDILAAGQEPKPRAVETEAPVAEPEVAKPARGRRRKAEPAETAPSAVADAETPAAEEPAMALEAPAPEAEAPKPRRSRKKTEAE